MSRYYNPIGHLAWTIAATSIAVYFLLATIGVIAIGTTVYITSQDGFQNVSFDIPYEWQESWNNFCDNIYNTWNNISNWWNGLFDCSSNSISEDLSISNSLSLMNYYQLANTQDPYARPGQKKQGRELKNKSRAKFTTRNKFMGEPKPPKHHFHGREHRKCLRCYYGGLLTMKKITGGIWINKDCKAHYTDSKKQGLRLIFHRNIPDDYVDEIKKYIKYLRNLYFFPIRCKVHFCYQESFLSKDRKHNVYGLFLHDENDKEFPEIFVPVLENGKLSELEYIIFNLNLLITYYFQWYFYQDKERSNRSLEIEATKYAKYLTWDYLKKAK